MKYSFRPSAVFMAAVLLLGGQAFAASTTVNYVCADNKPLTITYDIGEATMTARMKVDAIPRVLQRDHQASDQEMTIFRGEEHNMITDALNVNNLRTATVTSISNEVNVVRYENCKPVNKAAAVAAPATSRGNTVNYSCDGGKRVTLAYEFGEANMGIRANLQGAQRRLMQDFGQSNAEMDVFKGDGYQIMTSKVNTNNAREAEVDQITRETVTRVSGKRMPVSQILYKNCTAD